MCYFKRRLGPRYVMLEIAKPTEVERDEAEYRSAYLLLMENVRMQLMIYTMGGMLEAGSRRPRISSRARYTTESLQPHGIASFEDFERYTPHQAGWMVLAELSVHPEDVDRALLVLGEAGMEVGRARRGWRRY